MTKISYFLRNNMRKKHYKFGYPSKLSKYSNIMFLLNSDFPSAVNNFFFFIPLSSSTQILELDWQGLISCLNRSFTDLANVASLWFPRVWSAYWWGSQCVVVTHWKLSLFTSCLFWKTISNHISWHWKWYAVANNDIWTSVQSSVLSRYTEVSSLPQVPFTSLQWSVCLLGLT